MVKKVLRPLELLTGEHLLAILIKDENNHKKWLYEIDPNQ